MWIYSWDPNKQGVLISRGVGTLCNNQKSGGEGVGNFDKIKRKELFGNEIQF